MSIDWLTIRHFERWEFRGLDTGIEPDEELVEMLDEARERCGIPFSITSGIRTDEQNEAAGGVPGSAHTKGRAVDLACTDSRSRFLMVEALLGVGFDRIGVGRTFIHVDVSKDKDARVIWLYE